jgi:hypothetical protein
MWRCFPLYLYRKKYQFKIGFHQNAYEFKNNFSFYVFCPSVLWTWSAIIEKVYTIQTVYLYSVLFRTIYYYQVVFRVMKPWTQTTRPSLLWRPTIWRHNIRVRLDVPWIALLRHAGSVNALPLIATPIGLSHKIMI